MKGVRFASAVLVPVLLVLGLLASCAPGATPAPATPAPVPAAPVVSPEWQKVLEAAKREGLVTIYSGGGGEFVQALVQWFPKHTSITADAIGLGGAETREKVRMEQQSGAYTADVVISFISAPADLTAWGLTQPIAVELPSERDKAVFRVGIWKYDDGSRRLMVYNQDIEPTILVNTNLVKSGEVTSWNDLLDPRWKGKIMMLDPRYRGGSIGMAFAASELGKDYWKKVAAQEPRFDRNAARVVQAVAMGEKAIAVFAQSVMGREAVLAGLPVKFVNLKEGSGVGTWAGCIVKNAPHPNAALVFMNWLISKEGHTAIMRAYKRAGMRKDIDPTWLDIPEFHPDAAKRLFSKESSRPEDSDYSIAFYIEVFGKP